MTLDAPWQPLVDRDLPAARVHKLVGLAADKFATLLPHPTTLLVVHRGGLLLESVLLSHVHVPGTIDLRGRNLCLPKGAERVSRILLCDVITDTGLTFLRCAEFIRVLYPSSHISFYSVFATARAIAALRCSGHEEVYTHEILGTKGAIAREPLDIPYDFGEVAEACDLVRSSTVRGAAARSKTWVGEW